MAVKDEKRQRKRNFEGQSCSTSDLPEYMVKTLAVVKDNSESPVCPTSNHFPGSP